MADDLVQNLTSYKIQLEQVEAALSSDPDNEDLKKLKQDLEDVIILTIDLIEKQDGFSHIVIDENIKNEIEWKVGDKCFAIWSKNGNYYEAIVDEIIDEKHATITFAKYGTKDVSIIKTLKEYSPENFEEYVTKYAKNNVHEASSVVASVHPLNPHSISTKDKLKNKKEFIKAQQEARKKKVTKKAQRLKMLESEGEVEKQKWKNFSIKASSKLKRGFTKKSIFATNDIGRVGVGTCGTSGKPMSKQTLGYATTKYPRQHPTTT